MQVSRFSLIYIVGERIARRDGSVSDLLYVDECTTPKYHSRAVWVMCPDCCTVFSVLLSAVRSGNTSRCAACAKKHTGILLRKHVLGDRYGRLRVISEDLERPYNGEMHYTCLCDCGEVIHGVRGSSLRNGHTQSCGCLQPDKVRENTPGWSIGTVVGFYRVLKESPSHRRGRTYLVEHVLTGEVSVKTQGYISRAWRYPHVVKARQLFSGFWHRGRNSKKLVPYVGMCRDDLLVYLGDVRVGYEIDHICPWVQSIDLEEALRLCHYSNLRIVSKQENRSKGSKKTPEGEELCERLLGRKWRD